MSVLICVDDASFVLLCRTVAARTWRSETASTKSSKLFRVCLCNEAARQPFQIKRKTCSGRLLAGLLHAGHIRDAVGMHIAVDECKTEWSRAIAAPHVLHVRRRCRSQENAKNSLFLRVAFVGRDLSIAKITTATMGSVLVSAKTTRAAMFSRRAYGTQKSACFSKGVFARKNVFDEMDVRFSKAAGHFAVCCTKRRKRCKYQCFGHGRDAKGMDACSNVSCSTFLCSMLHEEAKTLQIPVFWAWSRKAWTLVATCLVPHSCAVCCIKRRKRFK